MSTAQPLTRNSLYRNKIKTSEGRRKEKHGGAKPYTEDRRVAESWQTLARHNWIQDSHT
jgi:hypothetical protein